MQAKSLREQISWVKVHWQPYRSRIGLIVVLTLLDAAIIVTMPLFLQHVIDGISDQVEVNQLLLNVGLLVVFGSAHAAGYYYLVKQRMTANLSLDYSIRMRAFATLCRKGLGFVQKFRTGDIVTRLTDDVTEKLAWYLCSGLFRTFEATTVIIFGLIMMMRISPKLTLYAAGPLPILIGIFVLSANKLEERYREVQSSISQINDSLESAFSGIRIVKGFAAENIQIQEVDRAIERQRAAEVRAVRYQTVIDSLYGNIWQLAILGVLLIGGTMVMRGELTLGELVAFDSYILLLVWPMFDIGQFLVRGRVSAVSITRISELEEAAPALADDRFAKDRIWIPGDPKPQATDWQRLGPTSVAFENVTFDYEGSETSALKNLSFEVAPGTMTAITGPIGAGKTSILRLIPRLADPQHGRIFLGDRALPDWDLSLLRQAVGYVPQEPFLFSTTIRENIRFGRDWITEDDITWAIRVSCLEEEIASFGDRDQTLVGPRGVRLSGGQKQRVSLARALAGRPAVLLLDDATASLDAATEDKVLGGIYEELPSCTTLLITHRPATLERAQQIVMMVDGEVLEIGPFERLRASGGPFADHYEEWMLRAEMRDQS